MRFVRFLIKEFLINGILFAILGTVALSSLYLLSISAMNKTTTVESTVIEETITADSADMDSPAAAATTKPVKAENSTLKLFKQTFKSFGLMFIGKADYANAKSGFSSVDIILAGAKYTLPLTLLAFIYIIIISLFGASFSVAGRYLALHFNIKAPEVIENILAFLNSVLAAAPLFVGLWLMEVASIDFLVLIALGTVLFGGLAWDTTKYLKTDMLAQIGQTHAIVYSTLGRDLWYGLPIPGTYTGYLFSSSLPRFIPYLAGKVPAIIGSITIAEVAFDFPGLGKNLLDALVGTDIDLLVKSIFFLLCINAVVTFLVKTILFLIYPRVYEKAI